MKAELRHQREGSVLQILAAGSWSIQDFSASNFASAAGFNEVEAQVKTGNYTSLSLVTKDLKTWDSSLLVLFCHLAREAAKLKRDIVLEQLPDGMQRLMKLALQEVGGHAPKGNGKSSPRQQPGTLELIGDKVLAWSKICANILNFIGSSTQSLGRFLLGKSATSKRDFWIIFRECGVDALPIVSLTSLLLGLILAFVGSLQLKAFGAEIYTASLVSISMVRVMGPVLTGIVLAGRTGASFAAVIGSMQVNEEVDALESFGINPIDFLVMPRILGLAIMTPLLTVYANLMGILGGFLVSVSMMNIAPAVYIDGTINSLKLEYFWIGLFHALVFGFVIAISGCYQGIRCGRNADAVGKATTSAVVNSIVGIIVSTSIITIVLTVIKL